MIKIVIYIDFDGTLTLREGQKTIYSGFYSSLLLQPNTWLLKPADEVQALFIEKFGEYKSDFDYKKKDSDFLLSFKAITFLKELLNTDQVAINIVTKNTKDYVVAVLTYQGFSKEDIGKIKIFDSCDKFKDVKSSEKELRPATGRMPAYIFDDNKDDMSRMANALNKKYFKVKTYSKTPRQFKWLDYLKEIKEQLNSILDAEVASQSKHQEINLNLIHQEPLLDTACTQIVSSQENKTRQKRHVTFWKNLRNKKDSTIPASFPIAMKSSEFENIEPIKQFEESDFFNLLPNEMIEKIRSYFTEVRDHSSLSLVNTHLHSFFKPKLERYVFKKLLQGVIDDDFVTVKKILDAKPYLLLQEPQDVQIKKIESKKTWQKFRTEKPLTMAIKRNQLNMVLLLLYYFAELEKAGVIPCSRSEVLAQWSPSVNKPYDFQPLIDVIAKKGRNNFKGSEETENALLAFRKTMLPDEAIMLDNYYDVEQLIIESLNISENNDGLQSWSKLSLFCIRVTGFLQSLVTPGLAEVLRHATGSSIDSSSYYRASRDSNSDSGLGFNFVFCSEQGLISLHEWKYHPLNIKELTHYISQKQEKLTSLRLHLEQGGRLYEVPECSDEGVKSRLDPTFFI